MSVAPGRTRDYVIRMPKDTTIRTACEDIGCEAWRLGFDVILDERDPEKKDLADLIRSGATGRDYRELGGGGEVAVFRFAPRQRCFAEHRTRPARLLVATGGRTVREHTDMAGWAEDMTEHVARVEATKQRG